MPGPPVYLAAGWVRGGRQGYGDNRDDGEEHPDAGDRLRRFPAISVHPHPLGLHRLWVRQHHLLYCYAQYLPNWTFGCGGAGWDDAVRVKENAPELLERVMHFGGKPGVTPLSSGPLSRPGLSNTNSESRWPRFWCWSEQ